MNGHDANSSLAVSTGLPDGNSAPIKLLDNMSDETTPSVLQTMHELEMGILPATALDGQEGKLMRTPLSGNGAQMDSQVVASEHESLIFMVYLHLLGGGGIYRIAEGCNCRGWLIAGQLLVSDCKS